MVRFAIASPTQANCSTFIGHMRARTLGRRTLSILLWRTKCRMMPSLSRGYVKIDGSMFRQEVAPFLFAVRGVCIKPSLSRADIPTLVAVRTNTCEDFRNFDGSGYLPEKRVIKGKRNSRRPSHQNLKKYTKGSGDEQPSLSDSRHFTSPSLSHSHCQFDSALLPHLREWLRKGKDTSRAYICKLVAIKWNWFNHQWKKKIGRALIAWLPHTRTQRYLRATVKAAVQLRTHCEKEKKVIIS